MQSQSRTVREILIFVAALGLGLFVIPPLIWLAGTTSLGPYANGGMGALFSDFFQGLGSATPSFWVVVLGPYLLILVARGMFSFLFARKGGPATARPEAQRGQETQRRQAVREADAQGREQIARRQAVQQRAEPLLEEEDLPAESEEDSEASEPVPEPPRRMVPPQAREAAPQAPRPMPPPQPRQAPQMREPPPLSREAPLPQMRATPAPPREAPQSPQSRQPPVQPREPPVSMWPTTPAQQREAPAQPRQAPPPTREAPPQRRVESPRAPAAPPAPRAGAENAPDGSDVKSTNKPGKKRIPPTIGDL